MDKILVAVILGVLQIMKKQRKYIFIGIAALFIVCLVVSHVRNKPALRILIDGLPAANLSVKDFQTMSPVSTDANGILSYEVDSRKQEAALVPTSSGNYRLVQFPKKGIKTVDLRGRYTMTTEKRFILGFVEVEHSTEQYDFNDEEMAALMSGEKTREEMIALIKREKAEQKNTGLVGPN